MAAFSRTTRGTPCGHCGSPAKGNPCFDRIDREAMYRRTGADAPCEGDAYAHAERVRQRWAILSTFVGLLCIVLAVAVIWLATRT